MAGHICPECGVDILIFEKTLKISDVLYNKGLELARIRDLSGSIESLTKSIQFNKNNFYARNLLGLVYFEVGKTADALKQWIMSASLLTEGNPAVRYIEELQITPGLLDDCNDAISMYNNALGYIQQKSDDLAIIQLKKALEFSPNFIDAMNLLAFCHLIKGEKQVASVLVEKVLELDINNPITLNYYTALFPDKKKISLKEVREPEFATAETIFSGNFLSELRKKKMFSNNFFMVEALSFVVGVVCTIALLFLTYIPGRVADANAEINTLTAALTATEDNLSRAIQDSGYRIAQLELELTEAREDYARIQNIMGMADQEQRVDLGWDEIRNSNHLEAARIFALIDPVGMNDPTRARFEEGRDIAFRTASSAAYNDGFVYFSNGNFAAARTSLNISLEFAPNDSDLFGSIFFYLGRIAEEEGDVEMAIEYFRRVVEDFAMSPVPVLRQAEQGLERLGG